MSSAIHYVGERTIGAAARHTDGRLIGVVLARIQLPDVGEGNCHGRASEVDKLRRLASVERKLDYALRVDHLADAGAMSLDHHRGGFDHDLLGHGADFERYIDGGI